ncbi:cysteine desulfurase family protein [Martelella sp. HB161492]|uniref:cysteine desulfurase family protein n=1 Tax=Martelella sp. HB161492 TaxID=2720726 RepID=UPI001591DC18|nr:cysteine desulfurase family protein [Martelella sp. HB161492]
MSKFRTYLDWNATAMLLPEARAAAIEGLDLAGNASSVHREGRAVRARVEKARHAVADLVGAEAAHVIFTAGATEASNLVLTPDFRMGRSPVRLGGLYVSAIEHPAIFEGGRFAAGDRHEIAVLPDGRVDLEALKALLAAHDKAKGPALVAIMLVSNETGVIQPVEDAARIVHAHGGILVVDAVQAVGRIPVSIEAIGADFLILSSHKIGGPKGIGALVSRGETLMPAPLVRGGGQEKGHHSGTENVPAICGFGAAAAFSAAGLDARNQRIEGLRNRLEAAMRDLVPDLVIHGSASPRVANTSYFTLPGLKAETGQIAFDLEGIALSAGSACSSGKVGESHVLKAMGEDARQGALRISLGWETGDDDVDAAIAAFMRIAGRLKPSGKAA